MPPSKKPAATPASEPARMVGDVYPDNIPVDASGAVAQETELTPDQIREIGTMDAPSAMVNNHAPKKAAAMVSGDPRKLQWGGADGDVKYANIFQVFGRSNITVTLKRIGPPGREHDYGKLPEHEVDTYEGMVGYVRDHLWDGEEAIWEWKIRQQGTQRGSHNFRFSRDPIAMAAYQRRIEEYRAGSASQHQPSAVGAPPGYPQQPAFWAPPQQPAAPSGSSKAETDWLTRRVAELEDLVRKQAMAPQMPVAPPSPPASPTSAPAVAVAQPQPQPPPRYKLPDGRVAVWLDGQWLVPADQPAPRAPEPPQPPPAPPQLHAYPPGFAPVSLGAPQPAPPPPPAPPSGPAPIQGMPPGGEPGFVLGSTFVPANVGPGSPLPPGGVLAFRYQGQVFSTAPPPAPGPVHPPQAQAPVPLPGQQAQLGDDVMATFRNFENVVGQFKRVSGKVQEMGALFGMQAQDPAAAAAAPVASPEEQEAADATNHPFLDTGPVRLWRNTKTGKPELDVDLGTLLLNADKISAAWAGINESNVARARAEVELRERHLRAEREAIELEERKRLLSSNRQVQALPVASEPSGPTTAHHASVQFDPSQALHGPPIPQDPPADGEGSE